MDPSANTARTKPAEDLAPCSSANATVATSVAPKIEPIPAKTTESTTMPPAARMLPRGTSGSRRTTGGSVACCANSSMPPVSRAIVGIHRPAVGATLVASTVATMGPTTNTNSSSAASSEYAVWMACGSRSTCVQRARTSAPTEPMLDPVTMAAANSSQGLASTRSATISPTRPTAATPIAGRITRACPCRSTSRASSGAQIECTITYTAVICPARPYEP